MTSFAAAAAGGAVSLPAGMPHLRRRGVPPPAARPRGGPRAARSTRGVRAPYATAARAAGGGSPAPTPPTRIAPTPPTRFPYVGNLLQLGLSVERFFAVGPGRHCSSTPRHRMPVAPRNEGSRYMSMTWRAMGPADSARHVIGCHQDTRVHTRVDGVVGNIYACQTKLVLAMLNYKATLV